MQERDLLPEPVTQVRLQNVTESLVLGEHKHALIRLHRLINELHEHGHFPGPVFAFLRHRGTIGQVVRRMVTNLFDARDGGQHKPLTPDPRAALQLFLHGLHQRGVQRRLLRRHVHCDHLFGLLRQVLHDRRVRLQATQHKRRGQPLQTLLHGIR